MNDRFRFRCGITISHYDDEGNDIETLLLVNNVSIYDDGEVGFNRESLKEAVNEVVKRKNLTEEEERTLWNSLDEYEVFEVEDWYQIPADFIEQCTGLKDKNRKLIYEGDILGYFDNKIAVVYDNESPSFRLCGLDGSHYGHLSQEYVDSFGFKIIGNIHEKESK